MSHLEVVARMKVRAGQLEAFKSHAADMVRITREQDTKTLRYDWFLDEATMQCEVHEAYVDEQGLIEHNGHIMAARARLFAEAADDHRMAVYGEISPELARLFDKHAGGVGRFSFLGGLAAAPDV
jgi:quinol monooxygenase YgiN